MFGANKHLSLKGLDWLNFFIADVETGSGDVQFGELSEEAKVNAASGDVQIGSVGAVP